MSRIARKIIERRGYAVNGIAVKWLSEDSVKQRITRALKAERVSGIIPDTKTR
jgi:diacylglycerol kinase